MTLESLSNFEKVAGAGYGKSGSTLSLRTILQELQGLKRGLGAGFAANASVAITGLSAGRGDTLLSCIISGTTGADLDMTGSASIKGDRIKLVDTATSGKTLDVLWHQKS